MYDLETVSFRDKLGDNKMGIFSVNGKLYRFLVRFLDMMKLNFLWLVFSLPIVTIGPATIAAFHVTMKMVKDEEGHILPDFIKAFKSNLKQGIPLGLGTLFVFYSAYLNLELFNKMESNPIFFLFAFIIILAIGLTHLIYVYPIVARYENTLLNSLRNASEMTMKYFPKTLLMWLVMTILILLFMFNSTLMFFGLLIGPVSLFMTVSGFALSIFADID